MLLGGSFDENTQLGMSVALCIAHTDFPEDLRIQSLVPERDRICWCSAETVIGILDHQCLYQPDSCRRLEKCSEWLLRAYVL